MESLNSEAMKAILAHPHHTIWQLLLKVQNVSKYEQLKKKTKTKNRLPSSIIQKFSSVQSLSSVRLFATPWTAARQASLSITNSRCLPKPMSIKSVMPSNHLILCCPLLLLLSIFPSIRVFSNESGLWIFLLFSSVQFSRSVVSDSLRLHEPQHARPPCPSPIPGMEM